MKQTYLKFPTWKQLNAAPKINSRRIKFECYKSDAPVEVTEVKELTDETDPENKALADDSDEVKSLKKINRQVKQFNVVLGTKAKAEDFTSLQDEIKKLQTDIKTMKDADILKAMENINAANTKIWEQIKEMQEEKANEKEAGADKPKRGELVSRKAVDDFVKTTFKDGKKTHDQASIEIKAAETFGIPHTYDTGAEPTVIDAFTGRFVDPTLYQRKRKRNLILDNFTIRTIDVPKLIYLIKVEDGDDGGSTPGDAGGADWILSGEIKPKRSFRVGTGEAEAKKVAIFGTIEDKLLKDVPSFENWIREDFMDEMRETINDGLLNNDPAVNSKAPLGLKTNAVQFTATAGFLNKYAANESNYIDQIIAGIAFMADNKEEAGQVFVSNDVYYAIIALKDDNLRYQNNNLVYTSVLGQLYIAGVPIIRADSDDIPSTHVLITAVDLGFKMYAYGAMVFERGLNGEDFRYDRTSYRGYQEFLSFIPTNRENSVMYDTWANMQAGIEA
jgi:HK97 family phage major capsid protein